MSRSSSPVRLREVESSDGDFCLWLATEVDPHWWRISRFGPPTVRSFRIAFPLGLEAAFVIEADHDGAGRIPIGVCTVHDVWPGDGVIHLEVVLREDLSIGLDGLEAAAWEALLHEAAQRWSPTSTFAWRPAHLTPPPVPGWVMVRQAVFPEFAIGLRGVTDLAVYLTGIIDLEPLHGTGGETSFDSLQAFEVAVAVEQLVPGADPPEHPPAIRTIADAHRYLTSLARRSSS